MKFKKIPWRELWKQGLKQCPKCSEPKPILEFGKNKSTRDGFQYLCKEHEKEYRNRPENKIKRKEYNDENKEMMAKSYQKNKQKRNEYQKAYNFRRRKTDLNYRILSNLRTRLTKALKNNSKSKKTIELLGCSVEDLKIYLEAQFTDGMSWDNYGLWHVDHKIPCANFDMSDQRNQKACFNYTNLQPLWAVDNLKKTKNINVNY